VSHSTSGRGCGSYYRRVAQPISFGTRRRDFWRVSAVVCGAILLGAFMGYGSLAAGPLGMAAMVGAGVLCGVSARRSLMLGPYVVGAGITGALLLLPALTNTDPAVTYPVETGLIPFILDAIAAAAGVGLTAVSLVHRRR